MTMMNADGGLRLRIRRRLQPLGLGALICVFAASLIALVALALGALALTGWLMQLAVCLLGGEISLLAAILISNLTLSAGYYLGRRSKGI